MLMDPTIDRARGYMLLGIIYLHSIIAFAGGRDPAAITGSFLQIKLLAAHVSVFFFLSGMGARQIGRRRFPQVVRQGASLVLLAILSHVTGFVLMAALHGTGTDLAGSLAMLVKPIVYGTGHSTYVAWFFLSLAMARMLAWFVYRSLALFALVALGLAAFVFLGQRLGLPDNLWEWRTWPAAMLFFLIGTRLPTNLVIPIPHGLAAGMAAALLTWFNRPGVLWNGPCLSCDITFVSQPMVGGFGSVPVFLLQEVLFLAFLLAVSRLERPRWITTTARFVGGNSVQFLLLNGWFMVVFNPWILPLLPAQDSLWLFAILLAGGLAVHLALFQALRRPLDLLLLTSFRSVERMNIFQQQVRRLRLPQRQSAD
jgi:hypothetical protein